MVYKIASGKIKSSTRLYTLEKEDGKYATDTKSTARHVLEHFLPDDRENSDNELRREIRKEIQESIDKVDDKAFTKEEIIANLKKIQLKKTPGEDGLLTYLLSYCIEQSPS